MARYKWVRYECGNCKALLESPKTMAGLPDTCPQCGQVTTVPGPKRKAPEESGSDALAELAAATGSEEGDPLDELTHQLEDGREPSQVPRLPGGQVPSGSPTPRGDVWVIACESFGSSFALKQLTGGWTPFCTNRQTGPLRGNLFFMFSSAENAQRALQAISWDHTDFFSQRVERLPKNVWRRFVNGMDQFLQRQVGQRIDLLVLDPVLDPTERIVEHGGVLQRGEWQL